MKVYTLKPEVFQREKRKVVRRSIILSLLLLAAASVDCGRAVSSAGGGINWAFACAGCGGTRGAAAISEHAHRSV